MFSSPMTEKAIKIDKWRKKNKLSLICLGLAITEMIKKLHQNNYQKKEKLMDKQKSLK